VLIFFDTIINVIIEKEEMEMSSPIKPLADRVVAVREKAQEKTASGLYLPDSSKEKPVIATVVAVGPKVEQVAVGDKIVYKEYSTTDLKINETEYLIVKEDDVLATV
jgi:chaperonin 10 Kd subunit